MKGAIKANTVDKYLRPIRLQIVELVEPNATVLELGCGNGDLLFKLSDKIETGIGIDKSEQLITYASDRQNKEAISNLEFQSADILEDSFSHPETDYSISSLLFHVVPLDKAIELLRKQIATSKTTIICGFTEPKSTKHRILLWLDQRFTSHYSNFRNYKKNGYTKGLLNSIENIEYQTIDTFDPVIKIYKITNTPLQLPK